MNNRYRSPQYQTTYQTSSTIGIMDALNSWMQKATSTNVHSGVTAIPSSTSSKTQTGYYNALTPLTSTTSYTSSKNYNSTANAIPRHCYR